MGYPVEMIDKQTALYAYIGTSAIESAYAEIFNTILKEADFNAKMMPLNIREDDIGFFIYGFKDSQIKEGYFSREYWVTLHTLLDNMSEEAQLCGICDVISVENKQNIGKLYYGKALCELLHSKMDLTNATVAVYGNSAISKSALYNLKFFTPKEIILADMVVENCLQMQSILPNDQAFDIERKLPNELSADIIIDGENELFLVGDETFRYDDVLQTIAKIKTKEWMNHG